MLTIHPVPDVNPCICPELIVQCFQPVLRLLAYNGVFCCRIGGVGVIGFKLIFMCMFDCVGGQLSMAPLITCSQVKGNKYILLHDWEGNTGEIQFEGGSIVPPYGQANT